jgi:hypothetical protein
MPPLPITTVRTREQLGQAATAEVEGEIKSQVDPLQGQIGTLEDRSKSTLEGIGKMFGGILPHVDAAAEAVQGAWNTAQNQQAQIFSAASTRLNDLRQTRAQEAQAMAQKIGGPVSVGEFTEAVDPSIGSLAALGAGAQLNTNLYAQAGVQEANAWAGKVFPLIQTEETAKARGKFEEDIKELEKQITAIKGAKSSKVNAKISDMLVKEREYALGKAEQGLNKTKADRDWKATLRTLKNDETRLRIAEEELKLRREEATGMVDGKPTVEMQKLTAAQKQQAEAMGMSEKEYALRLKELNSSIKINKDKLNAANRTTWAQYLDAAVNPSPGKTVTISQAVPVPATSAISGRVKDAYPDPTSPTGYSRIQQTKTTPVTEAITNPNQLITYLQSHGVPKKVAINMVKQRLSLPNSWVPGQPAPGTPTRPTPTDAKGNPIPPAGK